MRGTLEIRTPGRFPRPGTRSRLGTRAGTFVILTAAAMAFLLGFVVLVTDFGYAYAERQRVLGILDMAGMATLLTVRPLDDASGRTSVEQILTANAVNPAVLRAGLDGVDVTVQGQGLSIRINTVIPINAVFGNYFGMTQYPTAATSVTTAIIQLEQPFMEGFGMFACDTLTIRNDMWSYDSRNGPNEGPPNAMPNFTGCTQNLVVGENCGDNFLVGSNGDVIFDGGSQVWGNVVSGGRIFRGSGATGAISGKARVAAPEPGGIWDVTVHGERFFSYPFVPIDCAESTHFPDFLQDHDSDGSHVHLGDTCPGAPNCYDDMREIEQDDDPDGEDDSSFPVRVLGTTHFYLVGNRTYDAASASTGSGESLTLNDTVFQPHNLNGGTGESVLFHNNPTIAHLSGGTGWGSRGEYEKNPGNWIPRWPMEMSPLNNKGAPYWDGGTSNDGGWIWSDTNHEPYFRTGVAYFFHKMTLAGSTVYTFEGDFQRDGPVIWFIHGNGRVTGKADFKGNSATFRYTGLCGGVPCLAGVKDLPALRIYATNQSYIDLAGNFEMAVDVIAPGAKLDMTGTSGALGRVLGDVVAMGGTAQFSFDESLLEGSADQPFQIRIVRARIVQ